MCEKHVVKTLEYNIRNNYFESALNPRHIVLDRNCDWSPQIGARSYLRSIHEMLRSIVDALDPKM
jgi:hypothetical protein